MRIYHIGIISLEKKSTNREPKAVGGIQSFISELIHFLYAERIKVGLIGKIYNYNDSIKLKYHEIQNKITSTNKFLFFLFVKSFFIKLPKDVIIHAHRPDHYAAFAFVKSNLSVISLHGQTARIINDRKGKIVRSIYSILERIAFKKAKVIIPVDEITKEYYLKLYPQYQNKFLVIPTSIDTKIFRPIQNSTIRQHYGFKNSDKIVLYVGRLDPPKKVGDIVRAFKILADQDKDYKLVFVGNGTLFNQTKELVSSLKLEGSVNFFGVKKRNELPEIYNMANVSVLYSKNEGSPISIKESLACGIPVVANCVGDIPKVIIDGYNGFLVKKENTTQLALSIKEATEKSKLLKEQCIESVSDYTNSKVYSQIVDLYKKVLDEG